MRVAKIGLALMVSISLSMPVFSETSISGSAATQIRRNSQPKNDENGRMHIDEAFVRAEPVINATSEKPVISVRLRLRLQANFGDTKNATALVQEAYFRAPVSRLTLTVGRWYEIYSPTNFFGRYLFGVSAIKNNLKNTVGYGSGSFNVNYTALDGLRITVPLMSQYSLDLNLGLLPAGSDFENIYAMILASSKPTDFLTVNLGVNFQVIEPGDVNPAHRAIANFSYQVIKDLNIFAEYGITDLERIGDESWIAGGIDIPTGGILDMLRAEMEFHKDRLISGSQGDFAVIGHIRKKFGILALDLAAGSDPNFFGSQKFTDIGVSARVTAKF